MLEKGNRRLKEMSDVMNREEERKRVTLFLSSYLFPTGEEGWRRVKSKFIKHCTG